MKFHWFKPVSIFTHARLEMSQITSNVYMHTFRFKSEDRDRFFTSAQRTLIVDEILKRTPYGDGKKKHSKV